MTDLKPLLMEVKHFFFKQFKDHDKIYFISPQDKLRITGTLKYHIDEIADPDLKEHVLGNSTKVLKSKRINWKQLEGLCI